MEILSEFVTRHSGACGDDVLKARLLFARELLVRYRVPYRNIWRYAGFASAREMEHSWERLF